MDKVFRALKASANRLFVSFVSEGEMMKWDEVFDETGALPLFVSCAIEEESILGTPFFEKVEFQQYASALLDWRVVNIESVPPVILGLYFLDAMDRLKNTPGVATKRGSFTEVDVHRAKEALPWDRIVDFQNSRREQPKHTLALR